MTPITYKEAATLLGVKEAALRSAVGRGIFARLPRTSAKQTLIREQVTLFQSKGRLSLHVLSAQEKEIWARYANAVNKTPAQASAPTPAINAATLGLLAGAGAGTVALMPVVLPAINGTLPKVEVPQGNPFPVWQILLKVIPS